MPTELYAITLEEDMKGLDAFLSFYGWQVLEMGDDKYTLYDYLRDKVVESNLYLREIIKIIVEKAIDYYVNESNHIKNFEFYYYMETLARISEEIKNKNIFWE